MEKAEVASLEFRLTDELYYGIVKDKPQSRAVYLNAFHFSDPNTHFIPIFSSIEKVMAYLFWRGYNSNEAFIQSVSRDDAVGFADGVRSAGYHGFLFDLAMNDQEDVVFFGFDQMKAWGNAQA